MSIIPGKHRNLPRAEYDKIDAINYSILKVGIERSMAHLKWERDHPTEPTKDLIFGNACHLACWEPARFLEEVVAAPKVDRRTKDGKEEWANFLSASEGKLVIEGNDGETGSERMMSPGANFVMSGGGV